MEKNEVVVVIVISILVSLFMSKAISNNDINKTLHTQNYYVDHNEKIYNAENILRSKEGQYFYINKNNEESIFSLFTEKQTPLDIKDITAIYDINEKKHFIEDIVIQENTCYLKYNNNCILEIKAMSQSFYNLKKVTLIVFIICGIFVVISFVIKVLYDFIKEL